MGNDGRRMRWENVCSVTFSLFARVIAGTRTYLIVDNVIFTKKIMIKRVYNAYKKPKEKLIQFVLNYATLLGVNTYPSPLLELRLFSFSWKDKLLIINYHSYLKPFYSMYLP